VQSSQGPLSYLPCESGVLLKLTAGPPPTPQPNPTPPPPKPRLTHPPHNPTPPHTTKGENLRFIAVRKSLSTPTLSTIAPPGSSCVLKCSCQVAS